MNRNFPFAFCSEGKNGQVADQDPATESADTLIVLVWTDSGQHETFDFLLRPFTHQFNATADRLDFCPVFFEKDLLGEYDGEENLGDSQCSKSKQPLSVLLERYGMTVNWEKAAADPVIAIQELFTFQAAAELQYLNMLESLISNHISQAKASQTRTDISSILHFDYAKSILIRHDAHIESLISWFEKGLSGWTHGLVMGDDRDQKAMSMVEIDLAYLLTRIRNTIALCEAGREAIMSNAAIEETKKSREETQLVIQLTKATNRLTFIFLPISLVTSAFGMNFKQFGQGHLSLWLWVWITLPLLAACILLVERGGYLVSGLINFVRNRRR